MFQTEDYARAVIVGGGPLELREDETERRVALRMERQAFRKENAELDAWLILHEAVLWNRIGGRKVMFDQIHRLISEARNPWVTIQVITFSAGAHPSMAGAFGIFGFKEDNDQDVAYVDSAIGILYLEKPEEVKAVSLNFDHLIAAVLNKDESMALLDWSGRYLVAGVERCVRPCTGLGHGVHWRELIGRHRDRGEDGPSACPDIRRENGQASFPSTRGQWSRIRHRSSSTCRSRSARSSGGAAMRYWRRRMSQAG